MKPYDLKFRVTECSVVPTSKAEVDEHLSHIPIRGDREIKADRQGKLKQDFDNGLARAFHWTTVHCKESGEIFRINGNHTTDMMRNGMIPYEGFQIIKTRYEVEYSREVFQLYCTMDPHVCHRNSKEVLKAHIEEDGRFTKENGFPFDFVEVIDKGLATAVCGHNFNQKLTFNGRANVIFNYGDFVNWCQKVFYPIVVDPNTQKEVRTVPSSKFLTVGIFYAVWVTYNLDAAAAIDFWSEVLLTKVNPNSMSGSRKLHERLMGGIPVSPGRKGVQWFDFVHYCLGAFQTWTRGSNIEELRPRYRRWGTPGLSHYITHENSGVITSFQPDERWKPTKKEKKADIKEEVGEEYSPESLFDGDVEEAMRIAESRERKHVEAEEV